MKHLPGKTKEIADAISRKQFDRFFSLAQQAQRTPTPTPGSLTKALKAQLQDLINHSISASTKSTYRAGVRKFLQFCDRYGVQPLPADKETVVFFAVAMSRCMSPSSIQVYLAAVGSLHRQLGYKAPTHKNPSVPRSQTSPSYSRTYNQTANYGTNLEKDIG